MDVIIQANKQFERPLVLPGVPTQP